MRIRHGKPCFRFGTNNKPCIVLNKKTARNGRSFFYTLMIPKGEREGGACRYHNSACFAEAASCSLCLIRSSGDQRILRTPAATIAPVWICTPFEDSCVRPNPDIVINNHHRQVILRQLFRHIVHISSKPNRVYLLVNSGTRKKRNKHPSVNNPAKMVDKSHYT